MRDGVPRQWNKTDVAWPAVGIGFGICAIRHFVLDCDVMFVFYVDFLFDTLYIM